MMMKHTLALFLLLIPFSLIAQEEAQQLFDGKSLTGWDGDPRLWSVRDGVIRGVANTPETRLKSNSFLIWKGGEVEDFELEIVARVEGNNNSGIQYRAKRLGTEGWRVGGYQMDMHPAPELFGMLYEEAGRGILSRRGQMVTIGPKKALKETAKIDRSVELNLDEWNTFKVRAQGNVLTHWVNGTVTTVATDNDPEGRSMKGIIAIQAHGGKPMAVEVKSVRLTKLKPGQAMPAPKIVKSAAAVSAKPKPAGKKPVNKAKGATPEWVWTRQGDVGKTSAYFRKSFDLTHKKKTAVLTVTADNAFEAFLNGKRVMEGSNWGRRYAMDVRALVKTGRNVIAIQGRNAGGIAGMAATLEISDGEGKTTRIVSDKSWKATEKPGKDWETVTFDDKGWKTVGHSGHSYGKMGVAPWGNVFGGKAVGGDEVGKKKGGPQKTAPSNDTVKTLEGFKVDQIFEVDKATMGSFVSMTVDGNGDLICSDQGKNGIWRLKLGTSGDGVDRRDGVTASKLPIDLSGAQGLLALDGVLYATVNGKSGFYKVTDSNGDSEYDKVEQLRAFHGGGEHGPHDVTLGPDGMLYVMGGNNTRIPTPEQSRVPKVWAEDQLLERMPDARGHAKNLMAPGGWICRTDREGKTFELFSAGYRNQYGMAFNGDGEVFVYDSDMEWDAGTPWYRPTRICHATQGSEFGWRNGNGKFPSSYSDSLPAVVDIGPGSPTAVIDGKGAKFPAKYQKAIYAFDWTYGALWAIHQTPKGSSYVCEKEEFVGGTALHLTDGVVHPDGNLYFAIGGRGTPSAIYRVSYVGDESTEPANLANSEGAEARATRRTLEALQKPRDGAVETLWPHLSSEDRFIRYAARVALEHQEVATWQDKALAESEPVAALSALLALCRHGDSSLQPKVVDALNQIPFLTLSPDLQGELLRVYGLAFIRLGAPTADQKQAVHNRLDMAYPLADDLLNRELCRLLVYVESPNVAAKTVSLLEQATTENDQDYDRALMARSHYGNAFNTASDSGAHQSQIHYALCLSHLKERAAWTDDLWTRYFGWFSRARNFKGGNSFSGYIDNIRRKSLANAPEELRADLDKLSQEKARPVPEGFDDATKLTLGCLPGMLFDQKELRAKAGEAIAMTFVNNDPNKIMHNVAIVERGKADAVMTAAITMGASGMVKNFLPDTSDLLAGTPMVQPGKSYVLYFKAPNNPGDYPYICTYPGHGTIMRGILVVE